MEVEVGRVASIDWPILGSQVGLGAILGFAVGYTAKKFLKVALVVVGILVVLGALLEQYGYITVHWTRVEELYARHIEAAGGFRGLAESWARTLGALIPVTGSFLVGFLLGMRRG